MVSLCEVTFEPVSQLKRIESSAFSETSLQSIWIPASVEYIGHLCFFLCEALSTLVFESESNLKKIGDSAFLFTLLTEDVLPSSVKKVGRSYFGTLMESGK
jgi:hypothetical protein